METILFNGNVLTQDGGRRASAIGVDGGRIVAVGDNASVRQGANGATVLLDLKGLTVVPGFEDAHAHVWKMGHLLTSMLDLRGCGSLDDLGRLLKQRSASLRKDAWLLGRGFNEAALAEGRSPTRADLDRFAPDRPVLLTRTCGHIFVANTEALRLAGIDRSTEAPTGGVIEQDPDGRPNGILHETAIGLMQKVIPPPSAEDYEEMIRAALGHQLSLGITASSDCGVGPELLEVYLDMALRGALPARMNVMPLGRPDGTSGPLNLPEQYRSPMLRIDTVKFLADGGLSGGTAALSTPYRGSSSTGVLRFETEELRSLFQQARRQGWRIATHAIGDVAIEQVLSLYEELGRAGDGGGDRIEHFGLPDAPQLDRAARMGIISATQSIFLRELGRNFLAAVPEKLFAKIYPFRQMLEAGLTVALSSDAPVVEDDSPLAGMHAAVTRATREGQEIVPEQRITAEQALYCYTMGGAHAAGQQHERGSIQVGKWADLAVLSADPTAIDPMAVDPAIDSGSLLDIRVEKTLVAGRVVYTRKPED